MPSPRSTTIIVVNYKVADCVIDCIGSLRDEVAKCPNSRLIVVDNDSQDGSVEAIQEFIDEEGYEDWASVVPSTHNGGYAFGNNFAVRLSCERGEETEYYWLLNPDSTVIPGALSTLLDFMDATPAAGISGSSILQEDGSLWPICFRFPTVLSEVERGLQFGPATRLLANWKVPREMSGRTEQVDWLPGASTLIRKSTLDEVGLLDEGYFLYYEETDFALNALKKGWQCWYVPQSRITHVGGVSTGVSSSEQVDEARHPRIPQYIFDSRYRYFRKNHGLAYTVLADAAWLGCYFLRRMRHTLTLRKRTDAPYLMRDSLANSIFLRWIWRTR